MIPAEQNSISGTTDRISIIVPVYKAEAYLPQCLDCVTGQTYRNLDIILIDDGSPDRCGEICDRYAERDPRIRVFHTENRGVSAARNLGLEKAREIGSAYVAFADSDDYMEKEMYEIMLRAMIRTGADMAVCSYTKFGTDGKHIASPLIDGMYNREEGVRFFLSGRQPALWNRLFRLELFDSIAFPDGKVFEDVWMLTRLIPTVRLTVCIPGPYYHYRQQEESITHIHSVRFVLDGAEAYIDRYNYFSFEKTGFLDDGFGKKLQRDCIRAVFTLWKRMYSSTETERAEASERLRNISRFMRNTFPLSVYPKWSFEWRAKMFLSRKSGRLSFAAAHALDRLLRSGNGRKETGAR